MIKITKKQNGYAVLELLFYISFFAVLSLVVINAMITMAKSFRETAIQAEFMQSGNIMERISREIRQAYNISLISGSDLVLNTKDDAGVDKTVEFLLSSTNLRLIENGVLTGNLNTPNISVTAVTFTQITTAKGKAVKVTMTLVSQNDTLNRSQNFYDTVVLRGIY
ncbi:hypothetical protein A3A03_01805 [Candidatus Nomurabacteria bacterium RIFCSPLOWO2_01_FULL_40_18]|uniref:Uncharacterized protein n=1 Tax=Candidatus Nomurabacteria bacterium RIFCSPLOWO2_01_FULL_40_18 TaxID=1801773 RepID=A0A1F6XMB5_9BACT|nr:MAG: hypothetical protein A3A03_01805 [Candidatus Nomurabacteria bacterium RIFCSPLOWO2_01_FULL_40_18]